MMKKHWVLVMICLSFMISCTITRPIHTGFDVYLKEHPTEIDKIDQKVGYSVDEGTKKLVYEFRSFTTGIANKWVINVGEMLQSYLDVTIKNAFEDFKSVGETVSKESSIVMNFKINSYSFEGFRAKVDMKITTYKQGSVFFEKNYYAEGRGQAGKMYWGGVFGQRHAVHQSTQLAFDMIFKEYFSDYKTQIKDVK